mmetsp:Transcript_12543/g.39012  ORF Transcript_12543/g.39012 Transcript_12543/m.39012 type:complete len:203 (-) Transcript_12543:769-1377(-)
MSGVRLPSSVGLVGATGRCCPECLMKTSQLPARRALLALTAYWLACSPASVTLSYSRTRQPMAPIASFSAAAKACRASSCGPERTCCWTSIIQPSKPRVRHSATSRSTAASTERDGCTSAAMRSPSSSEATDFTVPYMRTPCWCAVTVHCGGGGDTTLCEKYTTPSTHSQYAGAYGMSFSCRPPPVTGPAVAVDQRGAIAPA